MAGKFSFLIWCSCANFRLQAGAKWGRVWGQVGEAWGVAEGWRGMWTVGGNRGSAEEWFLVGREGGGSGFLFISLFFFLHVAQDAFSRSQLVNGKANFYL